MLPKPLAHGFGVRTLNGLKDLQRLLIILDGRPHIPQVRVGKSEIPEVVALIMLDRCSTSKKMSGAVIVVVKTQQMIGCTFILDAMDIPLRGLEQRAIFLWLNVPNVVKLLLHLCFTKMNR